MLIFAASKKIDRTRWNSLATRDEGAVAIEFAILVPLLVVILMGALEITRALDVQRKVERLTRTVADLVSRGESQGNLGANTFNDILVSSKLTLSPLDSSGVKIVVSSIGIGPSGQGMTPWVCSSSASSNATPRNIGKAGSLKVPVGYQTEGMRYIFVEVEVPFKPLFGGSILGIFRVFNGDFSFHSNLSWPVRSGYHKYGNIYQEIVLPGGRECPLSIVVPEAK